MENSISAAGCSNLEQILRLVNISASPDILKGYLSEIFKDLAKKSGTSNNDVTVKNKVSSQAFLTYLDFPMVVSLKIFNGLDSEGFGYLKRNQFIDGLSLMSCGFMQLRIRMVFQIFDIDGDGIVRIDDICLLLSHFHMLSNKADISMVDKLIVKFSHGRETFTLFEFAKTVSEVNSDVFLLFLIFYAVYKPYDENLLNFYSSHGYTNIMHNEDGSISPNTRRRNYKLHSVDKNQHKSFSNCSNDFINFIKVRKLSDATQYGYFPLNEGKSNLIAYPTEGLFTYLNENFNMKLRYIQCETTTEKDLEDLYTFEEEMRKALKIIEVSSQKINRKEDDDVDVDNMYNDDNIDENMAYSQTSFEMKIKQSKFFVSRTSFANENISSHDDINDDIFNENKISRISVSENESESTNVSLCFKKNNQSKIPVYEAIVYISSHNGIKKKYKIILFHSNLFYFKYDSNTNSSTMPKFKKIQSLKATYITHSILSTDNNESFYMVTLTSSFSFSFSENVFTQNLLFTNKEDMQIFEYCFNRVTNYRRLTDEYIIDTEIAQGQFGKVRLGTNKKTGEKVAIKIIKKMLESSEEMIRWEYDIAKFLIKADHPGIIKGKDYFETYNSIYLVFEYIPGGNLTSFLWEINEAMSRKSQITEIIVSQVLDSMIYLHKFGIVHRDLKPDNILISYEKDNALTFQAKLIDFGLSKVMSRHETTAESYGSLCYSAPEILLKMDYNYNVDLWSFGVLVFYLYFSRLPFDDSDNDLTKIAKNILSAEVSIPNGTIKLEIRKMIENCLQKDYERRPELNELSKLLSIDN